MELTRQGRAFVGIAHRWQALWNETQEEALLSNEKSFYVASVGKPPCIHAANGVSGIYKEYAGMQPPCDDTSFE